MTDGKPLNDRKRRERALREVLGDDVYRRNRDAVDNAEEVREAARFIRQMREHAKLSQAALAQKLKVSQARISEIERGDSPEGVSYALLRRVAKACGFADWPVSPLESLETATMAVVGNSISSDPMGAYIGIRGFAKRRGEETFQHHGPSRYGATVVYGISAKGVMEVVEAHDPRANPFAPGYTTHIGWDFGDVGTEGKTPGAMIGQIELPLKSTK